jgi:hypothetical protein
MTGQSQMMSSFVGDGINVTNDYQSYTGLTPEDLAYISTNISKTANIVTNTTATFTGTSFLEPSAGSQLPPTSISNFTFYANSLPISYNEITGWGTDGMGNLVLTIDPTALGYYLTNNDNTNKTIIAVGKFA